MAATDSLRLAFAGDICLSFLREQKCSVGDLSKIRKLVGQYDAFIGNFESVLLPTPSDRRFSVQKMASAKSSLAVLHELGVTDLSLANNHTLDCGAEALIDTRKTLESFGFGIFGAGSNLKEAEQILYKKYGQRTVAFIGAGDTSRYFASSSRAGIAPLGRRRLQRQISKARPIADLVIVILHADLEFSSTPARWRQRLAHNLVDWGAHLVIQHHPHVLQGIEKYCDGVIAYSLGNFIFRVHGNAYQMNRPETFLSMILSIDVKFRKDKPSISYDFVPLSIGTDHFPVLPKTDDSIQIRHHVEKLSALLSDNQKMRRLWFERCKSEGMDRIYGAINSARKRQWKNALRYLTRPLLWSEDRRWVLGLLTLGRR